MVCLAVPELSGQQGRGCPDPTFGQGKCSGVILYLLQLLLWLKSVKN
jgi:hypothetical protein